MATISTITPSERHYDPTNDLLFKFVFGSEKRKHITLQFINDVIGLNGDKALSTFSSKTPNYHQKSRETSLAGLMFCRHQ